MVGTDRGLGVKGVASVVGHCDHGLAIPSQRNQKIKKPHQGLWNMRLGRLLVVFVSTQYLQDNTLKITMYFICLRDTHDHL